MRKTRQREAIRAALQTSGRPLSPQEVLAHAERAVPGLGIATVYRHLNALEDEGAIIALEGFGKGKRYEPAHSTHHHHFHCQSCDRVYDLEGCPGPRRIEAVAPQGFEVASHEVTLFGRCSDCTGS